MFPTEIEVVIHAEYYPCSLSLLSCSFYRSHYHTSCWCLYIPTDFLSLGNFSLAIDMDERITSNRPYVCMMHRGEYAPITWLVTTDRLPCEALAIVPISAFQTGKIDKLLGASQA